MKIPLAALMAVTSAVMAASGCRTPSGESKVVSDDDAQAACSPLEAPITLAPPPGPPTDGLLGLTLQNVKFWQTPVFPHGGSSFNPSVDSLDVSFFNLFSTPANTIISGARVTVPGKPNLALGFDPQTSVASANLAQKIEHQVITNTVTAGALARTIQISGGTYNGFQLVGGQLTLLSISVPAANGDGAQTLCLRSVGTISP